MGDTYSINKSRVGYAYQYKYALLIMLKFMLSGRLKDIGIDLPFSSGSLINLSLDIRLELINPDGVNIYEVKTGDNFKKDKIEELKKTLKNLYLYEESVGSACNKFIIISPDIESELLEHWNDFLFIKSNRLKSSHNETQKDVQKRVFLAFDFGSMGLKQNEFISFIKQITFQIGPSYIKNSGLDKLSDLEDQIKSEVDNFCAKLSLTNSEIEIPSWVIALELLEVLSQCVENNKVIIEEFFNKLNECLCRKRILKESVYEEDKNKILDRVKDGIRNELTNVTKLSFGENIKLI